MKNNNHITPTLEILQHLNKAISILNDVEEFSKLLGYEPSNTLLNPDVLQDMQDMLDQIERRL